jgi:signal transduction histidine kinase
METENGKRKTMMEKMMTLTGSFRARLMLLLTSFLLLTLVLVLALDRWAQKRAAQEVAKQSQQVKDAFNSSFGDFAQAMGLAVGSLSSDEYLYKTIPGGGMPPTVRDILITDEAGKVTDSTLRELINQYINVPEQPENASEAQNFDPIEGHVEIHGGMIKTFDIPVVTTKGLHWIVIVMQQQAIINQIDTASVTLADKNRQLSNYRLLTTTGLLALALAIAVWIGWRFTQPIKELAGAARRVAAGDLDFRLHINRKDEVGQLASTFNEMIAGLKSKLELEGKVNQIERAAVIGRFTQAIAHEIRNPLNVLNLSIDHLSSRFVPIEVEKREQFLRVIAPIKGEITRLRHMVSDILNYGRPAHLEIATVDMAAMVAETLDLVRPQADEQGVEIIMESAGGPAQVLGNAERLKSCLSNIVINALQVMPQGGRLTAHVKRTDGRVEVSFSDTGVGINQEALAKIFEPYYSTKQSGFGLGLAVTRKIVQEHQGSVSAESQPGNGTTFTIDLPAVSPSSTDRHEAI